MNCVRSIWGTYAYAVKGNAFWATPAGEMARRSAGAALITTLKRDILLFDSIYVVTDELDTVLGSLESKDRDDISMLKERSLICTYDQWFEPSKETDGVVRFDVTPLQEITGLLFNNLMAAQRGLFNMLRGESPLEVYSNAELTSAMRKTLESMRGMELENACALYFDLGRSTHDFQSRFHAEYLRDSEGLDVVAVVDGAVPPKILPKDGVKGLSTSDAVNVCLDVIPFPDLSAPWAQLIEYRSNEEVRRNYLALRRWLRKASLQFSDAAELRDEIEFLILERESHIKFHDLKLSHGGLEAILTMGAELLEGALKLKLSSAIKSLFAATHRKVQLMEAERSAPGKEIAYISDVRRHFSGTL